MGLTEPPEAPLDEAASLAAWCEVRLSSYSQRCEAPHLAWCSPEASSLKTLSDQVDCKGGFRW